MGFHEVLKFRKLEEGLLQRVQNTILNTEKVRRYVMDGTYRATQEDLDAVNKAIREVEEIVNRKLAEGLESSLERLNKERKL
jgi:hypothetical protein